MISRVYLDANIFIYMFEGGDKRAEKLREMLLVERKSEHKFLTTSELTLAETLVGAYRQASEHLIELYGNWAVSNDYLEVGPINRDILWRAAILRSTNKALKLPDAIHIATAFAFNCSHFLTGDEKLGSTLAFVDPRFWLGNEAKEISIVQPEFDILESLIATA